MDLGLSTTESEEDSDFDPLQGDEKHFPKARYEKLSSPEHDKDLAVCMDNGKKYLEGMMWKDPDKCEMRMCLAGGIITILHCAKYLFNRKKVPAGCKVIEENTDESYPECCERVECEVNDGIPPLPPLPNNN